MFPWGETCERFGDGNIVAHDLARVHWLERSVLSLAYSLALMTLSMLAVAALILTFQLLIAVCSGTAPSNAFPHLREEVIAFGCLTLGYMGLYLVLGILFLFLIQREIGHGPALAAAGDIRSRAPITTT